MLLLVFTHGYEIGIVYQYICRHQYGIGEQTCIYVVWILTCFVFERDCLFEFAQICLHIK